MSYGSNIALNSLQRDVNWRWSSYEAPPDKEKEVNGKIVKSNSYDLNRRYQGIK